MTEKMESGCIKVCQKLGKICTETYNMIKMAFREDSMSDTQVLEWIRRFIKGQISLESNEHPG
jgi:hypothetical protein